jgi:hypothetical protein
MITALADRRSSCPVTMQSSRRDESGELVLEDHAVVVELRLLEHHRRRAQRVLPRLHLVRRRFAAVVVEERR